MVTYIAFMRGEDRTEFSIEVEANSRDEAVRQIEEMYPEATIDDIENSSERALRFERDAEDRYEDDRYDDYDY